MEPSHSRPLAGLASKQLAVVSNGQLPVQNCRTRVLVVGNSGFMQRRLIEIVQSAQDLRTVGYADNGVEAKREDGVLGNSTINRVDGIVNVENKGSGMAFSVPEAAIKAGRVSRVVSKDKMKQLLLEVGNRALPKSRPTSHNELSYN